MAKRDTVAKDETLEDRVSRIEASQNWLAAIVRRILKRAEMHWGVDLDGDGKAGKIRVAFAVLILSAGLITAGTTVIVNWGTGVSGTIGTANISTDGTSATFTVDKIVVEEGGNSMSNLIVNGVLSVAGSGIISNVTLRVSGGASVGASLTVTGVQTNIGAQVAQGATTLNNLTVNTNATVTGTATFTSKPVLNAALIADGTLTNQPYDVSLPATCSDTNGVWIGITHAGTNMVIKAYPY